MTDRLVETRGARPGHGYPLGDAAVLIGRGSDCQIVVASEHACGGRAIGSHRDEGSAPRLIGYWVTVNTRSYGVPAAVTRIVYFPSGYVQGKRIRYGSELVLYRISSGASNPDSCFVDTRTTSLPIG